MSGPHAVHHGYIMGTSQRTSYSPHTPHGEMYAHLASALSRPLRASRDEMRATRSTPYPLRDLRREAMANNSLAFWSFNEMNAEEILGCERRDNFWDIIEQLQWTKGNDKECSEFLAALLCCAAEIIKLHE
jgi:hypothetical protein